ncbi:MAG TPA: hypothetical protein VFT74_08315 [Isosphaeraceae bacterium]|nr:hypothetical protein [Isosphaeraceae bacterium]
MLRMRTIATLLALGFALSAQTRTWAQSQPTPTALPSGFSVKADTVYLEEEWQLSIPDPDPINDGPQIKTYMSLVQDTSESYLWFMLNLRDKPGPFSPGGMQIQRWDYSEALLDSSAYDYREMWINNEVVTWRQRMTRPNAANNVCTFEICNGSSFTWGYFGTRYSGTDASYQPGPGKIRFTPRACMDFSQYNPLISVQMSRVSWEPNRVAYLRLLAVRQYDGSRNLLDLWTPTTNLDVDLTK